jgi:hypothetical protein
MADRVPLGDLAEIVRSKNAGPFWMTLDVIFNDTGAYEWVASQQVITAHTVAALYRVDPATVHVFQMPAITVIKASFPRRVPQGGIADSDMHSGQQQVPLAQLLVTRPPLDKNIDPRLDGGRQGIERIS